MSHLFCLGKPKARMENKLTPLTAKPRLGFIVGFVSWRSRASRGISVPPAHHTSIRLTRILLSIQTPLKGDIRSTFWNKHPFSSQTQTRNPTRPSQPTITMCRQYIRRCRDCDNLFPMPEPDMREPCEAFHKEKAINIHLKECPGKEIKLMRASSGHGGKVCGSCNKKNRDEQRKRENAQKRARRAKLKRDKMTAGIGAGNVVWTPPNTWAHGVVDAQTVALHSPQPQRLNTSKVLSTTQYGLNGSVSTATLAKTHTKAPQKERRVYSRSCHLFAATVSNALQPQENGHVNVTPELCDDTELHHQHRSGPQYVSTAKLDVPWYQEEQRDQIGLGITIPKDAKSGESNAETCSFFRMELNEWSTVFEDSDVSDDSKEL